MKSSPRPDVDGPWPLPRSRRASRMSGPTFVSLVAIAIATVTTLWVRLPDHGAPARNDKADRVFAGTSPAAPIDARSLAIDDRSSASAAYAVPVNMSVTALDHAAPPPPAADRPASVQRRSAPRRAGEIAEPSATRQGEWTAGVFER